MVKIFVESGDPFTQHYEGRIADTDSRFDQDKLKRDIELSKQRGKYHGPSHEPYINEDKYRKFQYS